MLNVGAVFFPTSDCTVAPITDPSQLAVEGASAFLTDFQAHFSDPNWKTIGSTPLAEALSAADAAFPDPSPTQGQRAVVVLTDGKPTCSEMDTDVLAPVQAMALRGDQDPMQSASPAQAEDAAVLLDLHCFGRRHGRVHRSCEPGRPPGGAREHRVDDARSVRVLARPRAGRPVARAPDRHGSGAHPDGYEIQPGTSSDGWSLSADGKTATLLGSVCDDAKDGTFSSVTFVYGCPVLPPH